MASSEDVSTRLGYSCTADVMVMARPRPCALNDGLSSANGDRWDLWQYRRPELSVVSAILRAWIVEIAYVLFGSGPRLHGL
jgi:hypothetical protein